MSIAVALLVLISAFVVYLLAACVAFVYIDSQTDGLVRDYYEQATYREQTRLWILWPLALIGFLRDRQRMKSNGA